MAHFHWMKSFYFEVAGWDPATGKPLPHTLRELGLERLIPIWKDVDNPRRRNRDYSNEFHKLKRRRIRDR